MSDDGDSDEMDVDVIQAYHNKRRGGDEQIGNQMFMMRSAEPANDSDELEEPDDDTQVANL